MQLKELLEEIDARKAEIEKLRPLKPEVEHRIMKKFRLDWNYHSNAIEGNSLTLGETRAFLLEGLTANGKPMKDHLDIKGHDDLITFLHSYILKKEPLTEADIRGMHQILLKESYETDAITAEGQIVKRKVRLGEYKKEPNAVRMGSGEIHQYVAPQDVAPEMAKLVSSLRKATTEKDVHVLVQAAIFHHRFVEIHPFDDGNGRMARILMNLILMRAGFPPAVIKLKDRDVYVAALRKADAGEPEAIASFIGQSLLDSENLYLRGAKGESIEDADDVDKEIALLKQELKNGPTPLALTWEIQRDHFQKDLVPFLERLNSKLFQFDELFAKTSANLQYNATTVGGGSFPPEGFAGSRSDIAANITKLKTHKYLLSEFRLVFMWEGFLRDGPNDFSLWINVFNISYEERKIRFSSEILKIDRLLLYGSWFSEDEVRTMLTEFTKYVLSMIQQRRSKTSP